MRLLSLFSWLSIKYFGGSVGGKGNGGRVDISQKEKKGNESEEKLYQAWEVESGVGTALSFLFLHPKATSVKKAHFFNKHAHFTDVQTALFIELEALYDRTRYDQTQDSDFIAACESSMQSALAAINSDAPVTPSESPDPLILFRGLITLLVYIEKKCLVSTFEEGEDNTVRLFRQRLHMVVADLLEVFTLVADFLPKRLSLLHVSCKVTQLSRLGWAVYKAWLNVDEEGGVESILAEISVLKLKKIFGSQLAKLTASGRRRPNAFAAIILQSLDKHSQEGASLSTFGKQVAMEASTHIFATFLQSVDPDMPSENVLTRLFRQLSLRDLDELRLQLDAQTVLANMEEEKEQDEDEKEQDEDESREEKIDTTGTWDHYLAQKVASYKARLAKKRRSACDKYKNELMQKTRFDLVMTLDSRHGVSSEDYFISADAYFSEKKALLMDHKCHQLKQYASETQVLEKTLFNTESESAPPTVLNKLLKDEFTETREKLVQLLGACRTNTSLLDFDTNKSFLNIITLNKEKLHPRLSVERLKEMPLDKQVKRCQDTFHRLGKPKSAQHTMQRFTVVVGRINQVMNQYFDQLLRTRRDMLVRNSDQIDQNKTQMRNKSLCECYISTEKIVDSLVKKKRGSLLCIDNKCCHDFKSRFQEKRKTALDKYCHDITFTRVCKRMEQRADIEKKMAQYRSCYAQVAGDKTGLALQAVLKDFYAKIQRKHPLICDSHVGPDNAKALFHLKRTCLEKALKQEKDKAADMLSTLPAAVYRRFHTANTLRSLLRQHVNSYYRDDSDMHSDSPNVMQKWVCLFDNWVNSEIEKIVHAVNVSTSPNETGQSFFDPLSFLVAFLSSGLLKPCWEKGVLRLLSDLKQVLNIDINLNPSFKDNYIDSIKSCVELLYLFFSVFLGSSPQDHELLFSDRLKKWLDDGDEEEKNALERLVMGLQHWVIFIQSQWADPTTLLFKLLEPQFEFVDPLLSQLRQVFPPIVDETDTDTNIAPHSSMKTIIALFKLFSHLGSKEQKEKTKNHVMACMKLLFTGFFVRLFHCSTAVNSETSVLHSIQWGQLSVGTMTLFDWDSAWYQPLLRFLRRMVLILSGLPTLLVSTSIGQSAIGYLPNVVQYLVALLRQMSLQLMPLCVDDFDVSVWLSHCFYATSHFVLQAPDIKDEASYAYLLSCYVTIQLRLFALPVLHIDTLNQQQLSVIKGYIRLFNYLIARDFSDDSSHEKYKKYRKKYDHLYKMAQGLSTLSGTLCDGVALSAECVPASEQAWCLSFLQVQKENENVMLSGESIQDNAVSILTTLGHTKGATELTSHLEDLSVSFFSNTPIPVGRQPESVQDPVSSPSITTMSVPAMSTLIGALQRKLVETGEHAGTLAKAVSRHSEKTRKFPKYMLFMFLLEGVLAASGLFTVQYLHVLSPHNFTIALGAVAGLVFFTGLVGVYYLLTRLTNKATEQASINTALRGLDHTTHPQPTHSGQLRQGNNDTHQDHPQTQPDEATTTELSLNSSM